MSAGGPTHIWWRVALLGTVLTHTITIGVSAKANWRIKSPTPIDLRTRNAQWKRNQRAHAK